MVSAGLRQYTLIDKNKRKRRRRRFIPDLSPKFPVIFLVDILFEFMNVLPTASTKAWKIYI